MKDNKPKYNEIIFTDEQKEDIINSYLNGESSVNIGKRYGTNHKPILKVLHNNNIEVNMSRSTRKYGVNEKYFDSIDTPNKAYILGFLYADGHNEISKGTVTMSLQEDDFEILEKIRIEIGSEKPLEYLDYSNKHDGGYNYKNQYRLNIFSIHMCRTLDGIGMIHDKSLKLTFPNIPEYLYKDFIRGYFDGDGSYCPHVLKSGKFQPLITITSAELFCKSIQKIIREKVGIPCGNIYNASCDNGITKVLSFSGKNQVKKFLEWIYEDAELYLDRKHKKYLDSYVNNSLSA